MHYKSAALPVPPEANFTFERSLLCMNEMMFIKTRIFGESSSTVFNRADVRFLTRMNSYVIFIIRRACESLAAFRLRTFVRTFAGMRSDVNLSDIAGGKGTTATIERAQEWTFSGVRANVF